MTMSNDDARVILAVMMNVDISQVNCRSHRSGGTWCTLQVERSNPPWFSTGISAQRGQCFFVAVDHRQHVPEACLD
jgi:hypothetical protein